MRLLVTGAAGLLGRDLLAETAGQPDIEVVALSRSGLDITDPAAVRAAVAGCDLVVNTAAWTDVDGAEADEDAATAVNATGTANVATACAEAGALLLQLSTDYVFAGRATTPYPEDAPVQPVNAYGRGKAAGEAAVRQILPAGGFVVRTAWLYGEHGRSFVSTMLRAAAGTEQLDVVSDASGQPTWSGRLAGQLVALGRAALAGRAEPGIYHGTASGSTTWYGLARAIFELSGLDPARIRPVTSDRFPRPAPRPAFSVLGHDRWAAAGLAPLPGWRPMLAEALARPAFAALRSAALRSAAVR
jgi:dTDP-4-dehydrorhamnose reductase